MIEISLCYGIRKQRIESPRRLPALSGLKIVDHCNEYGNIVYHATDKATTIIESRYETNRLMTTD